MIASKFGYSGLIRIVNCFVLMTITAGCSSTGVIDPNQSTIDPNSSVVAFSVNTGTLEGYEKPIRPKRLHIQYGLESVSIRLSDGKTGLQRILLEVPAQAVLFNRFELAVGAGLFLDRYWTSGGQPMKLSQGEITYLGRMEIEDIKFRENGDGSLGEPIAVKIVFADALDDDQLAWEQQYELFQNRVPNRQVVGNWAEQEYLELWFKEWPSHYAKNTGRRHAYDGGSGHPPRPGNAKDVGRRSGSGNGGRKN
jgi:hypothetical protein